MRTAFAALVAASAGALIVAIAPPARAAEERPPLDPASTFPMVPDGYFRDDHGRLLQTEFDMNRRVWLGGGWAPSWEKSSGGHAGQAEIDLGIRIDSTSDDNRWRGRFHLLESQFELGQVASARTTLFSYDESRKVDDPILRLSTFWPRPARHDVYLSLGFWCELLSVDAHPDAAPLTVVRPAATGLTWDIWHSQRLQNVLRLRLGAGVDDSVDNAGVQSFAVTGIGHLEFDAILDRKGFHRLSADAGSDVPIALRKPYPVRAHASAGVGYEVILLAINDQPITFRVAGRGGYRSDLPSLKSGLDAEGNAGLRVNLWAPPPKR